MSTNNYINDPSDPAFPLGEPAQNIEEEIQWREENGLLNSEEFRELEEQKLLELRELEEQRQREIDKLYDIMFEDELEQGY